MSLKFYDAPMSTAGITSLVLEELGVPFEKIKVDLRGGDTHKPEYLRLNPNGKVPLIVHDGIPIWESAAITMYLGETFGVEKGLYPTLGPKRGEAMKWIVWANVTAGDAAFRWARNTMEWTPAEQHNAKAAEAALKDIHDCLRILDEALDGKQFLLSSFTLADAHLYSFTSWLRFMKVDFAPYANLEAWNGRCAARPAAVRAAASG
ncbi:MAG: glutathione S-transferase family protein [Steroidobacteraceae bacterium]